MISALLLFLAFKFAIIGDRTGEHADHIHEQVLATAAKEHPDFYLSIGDLIEHDPSEWPDVLSIWKPYQPAFFTPGNHDVWSSETAAAFTRYTGRPLQYSFDWKGAHFIVLDEREDNPLAEIPPETLQFLKHDLETHADARPKFVVSHTPFWLLDAATHRIHSPMQEFAAKYGIAAFIAGHLHQYLEYEVAGVRYISVPSAGGHLRASKRPEDGWFFGYIIATVDGASVSFSVKDLQGQTMAAPGHASAPNSR